MQFVVLILEGKSFRAVVSVPVSPSLFFSSCVRVVEDSTVLGLFVAGYPAFSVQ